MKKLLFVVMFFNLVLLNLGSDIFTYKDIIGDDKGAGKITYPTDPVFVKGAFDIQNFKIYEEDNHYCFDFEVGTEFKNEWKNKNGWDIQMFDVYINLGTGKNKQSLAGRHVKIKEGWDIAFIVAPEEGKKFWEREILPKNDYVCDDESKPEDLIKDIKVPNSILIDKNKLTAKIEKKNMPDLKKMQYIQVFVSGAEGFPNSEDTYIRTVNEYNAKWRFGGGSDYYGDPNVIDILGDNKKLADYVSTEDKTVFPYVNMIKVGK